MIRPQPARRNGGLSRWYSELGGPPGPAIDRPPLRGRVRADVCVVGGGFTGLWTAWHLARRMPDASIVLLEREFCGFGASGRNGGWLSDHFAGSAERMASERGRDSVALLARLMRETVDDVIAACAGEGIEADIVRSGVLSVARSPAQVARMHAQLAAERAWGRGPEDLSLLDASALAARVAISGAGGALYSPWCARVQPARLVGGLARAVAARGVRIHEATPVRAIEPGRAVTESGVVEAPVVLRCLEGFTATLPGARRELLPLNSAMIVTAPLDAAAWERTGWAGAELVGDLAHAYMYAQRTADGRIALGGRGVPYRFGSRLDRGGATQPRTVAQLTTILHAMFPATVGVAIDQAWCGVLGVRRDWTPTVRFDRGVGLGEAGGYVGSGVGASYLAARALAALVLDDGRDAELRELPWVRGASRRWEPEPLRFLGARLVYGLYRAADRRESASDSPRTSWLARAAGLISGR